MTMNESLKPSVIRAEGPRVWVPLLCAAIFLFMPKTSHAVSFDFGVGADAVQLNVNGEPSALTYTSRLALPVADVGMDIGLTDGLDLDLAAMYVPRSFKDGFNTLTASTVQGSVLFRWWMADWLGLGVGGYYASGISMTSISYSNYGLVTADEGPAASLMISIPMSDGLALFLEGRANYSLNNAAVSSAESFHYLDVIGLLGLRFGDAGTGGF